MVETMRLVLETCVPLTVPRHIRGRIVANRQRRWAPNLAGIFVTDIDRFARRIDNVIVGPGREVILVAIGRPSKSGTGLRHDESESRIRNNVDPRFGRSEPRIKGRHILPGLLAEAAESIEKLQSLSRRRSFAVSARTGGAHLRKNARITNLRSRHLLGECSSPAEKNHTRNHLQLRSSRRSKQITSQQKNLPAR